MIFVQNCALVETKHARVATINRAIGNAGGECSYAGLPALFSVGRITKYCLHVETYEKSLRGKK